MGPGMSRVLLRAKVLGSMACTALLCCGPSPPAAWCPEPSVEIAAVQGATAASPLLGQRVELSGVVSATPASIGSRRGFFLQAETTPNGVFVAATDAGAAPGERWHVVGRVAEISGVTALVDPELMQPCGRAQLVAPELELAGAADAERWEGTWFHSRQTWTLLDTSELWGRGRVRISAHGRSYAAGHPLGAQAETWTLEGLSAWARAGFEGSSLSEQLRLGAQAAELTAVVLSGSPPTLLATQPVAFRSEAPEKLQPRAGALRVAALNLDNYFIDLGLRGAYSAPELSRQRDKLVAALRQLDADILALSELESPPPSAGATVSADADLIAALNAQLPDDLGYALSAAGPDPGGIIHSALAYRPNRLRPLGAAWAASTAELTRAPLFQTFNATGHELTVAAVHLKSKVCDGEAQLLGPEGCGAETRLAEARALAAIVEQLPVAQAERLLLIGDLNSDSREAPSLELQRAGLSDLFASVPPAERYSYVFDGRATQLDHALAGAGLVPALARAQIWHIDADEPELLDYHLDNPPELYRPDARRCSDHDPILVDFAL